MLNEVKNSLKGTTSSKKIADIPKAAKFNVVAYACTQNSANIEYLVYYAFINTDDDLVVMVLNGDMSIKEDLKSVFFDSLSTFRKVLPQKSNFKK